MAQFVCQSETAPLRRAYRGLTLVELLVVIAVTGLLIALLLPAVQAAREASRRLQCGNNLKQIGVAMHHYTDVYRVFPPGNITMGDYGEPSHAVWSVSLLPFLEQSAGARHYHPNVPLEDDSHADLRSQNLPVYNCPSDPNAGKLMVPAAGPHRDQLWRSSSYRGMGGVAWGVWGEYAYRRHWDCSDILQVACQRSNRGLLHWVGDVTKGAPPWIAPRPLRANETANYACESFATVLDGSSMTLAVGEYATRTEPRRTSFWAYGYTSFALSSMTPESRTLIADYDQCVEAGNSNPCKRAFGSFHAGNVIQFLKCDGSVYALTPMIDMHVYESLATIAGGEFGAPAYGHSKHGD